MLVMMMLLLPCCFRCMLEASSSSSPWRMWASQLSATGSHRVPLPTSGWMGSNRWFLCLVVVGCTERQKTPSPFAALASGCDAIELVRGEIEANQELLPYQDRPVVVVFRWQQPGRTLRTVRCACAVPWRCSPFVYPSGRYVEGSVSERLQCCAH